MILCPRAARALCVAIACYCLMGAEPASKRVTNEAVKPTDEPITLFNGKNLDGLYTWLQDTRYDDPRQVFTVADGQLNISGDGFGYVVTDRPYRDYHMVIEFRWGERTWEARKDRARDSGVLVHCHGPDGGYGERWMASVEAQIIEGGTGDVLVLTGTDPADGSEVPTSLTAEVTKDRDGETVWKAGGERKSFTSGRINWYGRDPDWDDVIGFRGDEDVEKPVGEWNRLEVICDGGHIVIKLNGVKVNEAFDAQPDEGQILVQTELAEMHVRRWELWPLGSQPK